MTDEELLKIEKRIADAQIEPSFAGVMNRAEEAAEQLINPKKTMT